MISIKYTKNTKEICRHQKPSWRTVDQRDPLMQPLYISCRYTWQRSSHKNISSDAVEAYGTLDGTHVNGEADSVSWHNHLRSFRQLNRPGNVSCTHEELRPARRFSKHNKGVLCDGLRRIERPFFCHPMTQLVLHPFVIAFDPSFSDPTECYIPTNIVAYSFEACVSYTRSTQIPFRTFSTNPSYGDVGKHRQVQPLRPACGKRSGYDIPTQHS